MAIINICKHCEEKCSGVYCRNCSTKEKRDAIDKENEEIRNKWKNKK